VLDQANLKRLRQVRRRLRHRQRRQARRLLDDAYQAYRRELGLPQNHSDNNNALSESIEPADPPASPVPEPPPSPRPNSPPPEPDSPHSVLTLRVRPDTPPRTPSISPPSYSPVHFPDDSPRPASPTNSTSSVEFIDEFYIPPPLPRHYYYYDPYQPLETLITQFPHRINLPPPGSYTIGPDDFDLIEIRNVIAGQDPDSIIPVFLPNSPFPYDVPVRFFYNLFPPSTTRITEILD